MFYAPSWIVFFVFPRSSIVTVHQGKSKPWKGILQSGGRSWIISIINNREDQKMKFAVRYYSKTGNTKRLAEAVAKALGVPALPVSEPVAEPVDILLLGNSYYAFTIDPEVRAFVKSLDKNKVGRIANFGTAAMMNSTWKKVKAEADKVGIPMDEREFHCKGEFKQIHKGRPNEEDLRAAEEFARGIIG
jgi:flavodoxin